MSDENDTPAEVVENVVTDPIEDPPESEVKETVEEVHPPKDENNDGIPDRLQRLETRVEELAASVNAAAAEPEAEAPGHNQEIKDESPHKRPWHKRGMFA